MSVVIHTALGINSVFRDNHSQPCDQRYRVVGVTAATVTKLPVTSGAMVGRVRTSSCVPELFQPSSSGFC